MTTFSTRGQDGPASRLLIHADDPGQANRLALLVSHYGHQPGILDTRQLLTPTQRGMPCSSVAASSAPRYALASPFGPTCRGSCSASGWGAIPSSPCCSRGVAGAPPLRRA